MNYIKNDLEELRKKIIEVRKISKDANNGWVKQSYAQTELHHLKGQFRARHILYCLIKGKSYKRIEQKVREGNEIMESLLKIVCLNYEGLSFDEIPKEKLEGLW